MPNIKHAITSRLPRLLRGTLEFGQRFGVNITPNHFYSEVPNFRHLRATDYWRQPMSMFGIQGSDVGAQLAAARACTAPYLEMLKSRNIHQESSRLNGEAGFGPNECDLLYAFVRSRKPTKVIQIGCGVSTATILLAAADEPEYNPEILCVEPYPSGYLKRLQSEGKITLLAEMAQTVPFEKLADLAPGDLLFVDSTHTLKPGSEVPILICEILPRLAAGVFAHFHDIAFPYNYNPWILDNRVFFHRETTLLYGYLVNNPTISIDMCTSMMQFADVETLKQILPNFKPGEHDRGVLTKDGDFPESAYLKIVATAGFEKAAHV